jgi:hypothetical protein
MAQTETCSLQEIKKNEGKNSQDELLCNEIEENKINFIENFPVDVKKEGIRKNSKSLAASKMLQKMPRNDRIIEGNLSRLIEELYNCNNSTRLHCIRNKVFFL